MKIQFTLTLSDKTVKALKQVEGLDSGEEVKDYLVEKLTEIIDETRDAYDPDEEEP